MGYLVLFLVATLGFYILFRKEENFIFYILFLQFFLMFILNKVQPNLTGKAGTFISILLVVLSIYIVFVKRKITILQFEILIKYLFIVVLTVLYLIVSAWGKNIDPIIYLKFIRNRFLFLIIFFFIIFAANRRVKNKLIYSIIFILFLEAGIGFLQHFRPRKIFDFFIMNPYKNSSGETVLLVAKKNIALGTVETGTLGRINYFANIVSLLIVYLAFELFNTKEITRKKWILITVAITVGIGAVILSGVKTSALSCIIGVWLVIFFKKRTVSFGIITVCIFLVIIYSQILYVRGLESVDSITENKKVSTFRNPIERLSAIFVLFQDPSNLDYKTSLTFRRTFALASYFSESPFIGSDNTGNRVMAIAMMEVPLFHIRMHFSCSP